MVNWAMFILSGLCFVLIGLLNELYSWDMDLINQIISSPVITLMELITEFIVNIGLGWGVWDYRQAPYNFYGRICLFIQTCGFSYLYPGSSWMITSGIVGWERINCTIESYRGIGTYDS